jgi:hypothetical protein
MSGLEHEVGVGAGRSLLSQSDNTRTILIIAFCSVLGVLVVALLVYQVRKCYTHWKLERANKADNVLNAQQRHERLVALDAEKRKRAVEKRKAFAQRLTMEEQQRRKRKEDQKKKAQAIEDDDTSDSLDLGDVVGGGSASPMPLSAHRANIRADASTVASEDSDSDSDIINIRAEAATTGGDDSDSDSDIMKNYLRGTPVGKKKKKKKKKKGNSTLAVPLPDLKGRLSAFTADVVNSTSKRHNDREGLNSFRKLKKKSSQEIVVDIEAFRKDVGLPNIERCVCVCVCVCVVFLKVKVHDASMYDYIYIHARVQRSECSPLGEAEGLGGSDDQFQATHQGPVDARRAAQGENGRQSAHVGQARGDRRQYVRHCMIAPYSLESIKIKLEQEGKGTIG